MNLNAIRAFVYTSETGSISAAARRMGRSRAQLSQWITSLEIDWNTKLFSREGYTPELTAEGKAMLDECKQMLRMEQYINQKVSSLQDGHSSEINIGVSRYLGYKTLAQAITLFHQKYPSIDCHFYGRCDEDLMSDPNNYDLSVGYYADVLNDYLHVEQVCEHTHLVVCGAGHPLATQDVVSILDFNQYTVADLRKETDKEYWPTLPDQKCWLVDDYEAALELTEANLTLFFTPKHRIEQELRDGKLLIVNHPKAVSVVRLGVSWQKPRNLSEPEKYLLECIKQVFCQHG